MPNQEPYIHPNEHYIQTHILEKAKIFMQSESLSSSQISEEQKHIPTDPDQFIQFLQPKAALTASNLSLEAPLNKNNRLEKEEVATKTGRKGRRGGQQLKNVNRGHWCTEQNKKYHWFLQIHYKHFVNRHMRRTDKIFKTMQLFIGTRQAQQCRSHHQKMEKKYLNFISIISNLREIHYFTQDIKQMQQQIESQGIQMMDQLATIEQLKAYKKNQDQVEILPQKKVINLKSPKPEKMANKFDPVPHEEKLELVQNADQHKQREIEDNGEPINMFEQSRNNIGDISMYHEKEDNSCIFQSMFQHQH